MLRVSGAEKISERQYSPTPRKGGIRAVFFDAGLTLIHSEPSLPERCAVIAKAYGFDVTPQQIAAVLPIANALMFANYRADPDVWSSDERLREHWRRFYVAIFGELGIQGDLDACSDAIYKHYNVPGAWQLYPDVLPTLSQLHAEGYVLGVISDWATTLPAQILLPLGIGHFIDFMVVSATLREAKPGYGLYREALTRARVEPNQAIHVGDNYINDILGARGAGIPGVLLDRHGLYEGHLDCPRISELTELLWILRET